MPNNLSLRIIDNTGNDRNGSVTLPGRNIIQNFSSVRQYTFHPSGSYPVRLYNGSPVQISRLIILIVPHINPIRCKGRAGKGDEGKQCK